MDARDQALVDLGMLLRASAYQFITVTPETHRRVNARAEQAEAQNLRDVFGWSRPFHPSLLSPAMIALLRRADAVQQEGEFLRSRVRYSSLGDMLLVHSAYPTHEPDAVFFGPDTYRFVALITQVVNAGRLDSINRVVDIGCGTGAGGIALACLLGSEQRLSQSLTDINRQALRYAMINAALAGIDNVLCIESDVLASLAGRFDLIVSNPPYLSDPGARLYRDGGGALGCNLSLRIVRESLPRLARGGRLILYTGSPVVAGKDMFWELVKPVLDAAKVSFDYAEVDPDVFGEELETTGYAQVERIAAVSLAVCAESS